MIVCDYCGTKNNDTANFCCMCAHGLRENIREKTEIESLNRELSLFWNGWEIIKKIGHGSYGSVYLAEHREKFCTARSAIKIISVPKTREEFDDILYQKGNDLAASKTYFSDIVDNCVKEVQLMVKLKSSPNVVYIEDFSVRENKENYGFGWNIFIKMELLTPFKNYKNERILTEEEIIKIGTDICGALEVCRKGDILHRDIKPQNILVSSGGEFKIGDFGIARQLENANLSLTKGQGTNNYMAPEVKIGPDYDFRADIYSLGIVLYELANNNRLPLLPNKQIKDITHSEEENALYRRFIGEKLPEPIGVSEDLARIILKACEFNSNKRFSSASEMKKALLDIRIPKSKSVSAKDPNVTKKVRPVTEIGSSDASNISESKNISVKDPNATKKVRPVTETGFSNASDDANDQNNQTAPTPSKKESAHEKTQMESHAAPAAEKEKKPSIFSRIFNFGRKISDKAAPKNNSDTLYPSDFAEVVYKPAKPSAQAAKIEKKPEPEKIVLISGYKYSNKNTSSLTIEDRKLTDEDLKNIGELRNLKALTLKKCDLSDISFVVDLFNLIELDLSGNQISDITPLADLIGLKCLKLYGNRISDISPLSNLTNLRTLWLSNNKISDIAPLANLNQLTNLNLLSNPIYDTSPLSELFASSAKIKLKRKTAAKGEKSFTNDRYSISETVWIAGSQYSIDTTSLTIKRSNLTNEDLGNIVKLKNLTALSLQKCGLSDIFFVASLTNLKTLHLHKNKISNIYPLANLTNLEVLCIYSKELSGIAPLANLTNLKALYLDYNKISDVTPLRNLTNLEKLHLNKNYISDITPLSDLTHLKFLYLESNNISNLTPLRNLINLEELDLGYNKMSDITPLHNLTHLKRLNLVSHNTPDITSLYNLTNLKELWLYGFRFDRENLPYNLRSKIKLIM